MRHATTIDRVKHDGAVNALKRRIESLRFELTNRNWDGIKEDPVYIRLGDAIHDARNILDQMQETLEALHELESDNR